MNGAACWARVITSHYVLSNITASIMWNLVGAYYHGTNWYASSMLTSVQPWSGNYNTFPVVWATSHVTQFTKIGWKYLTVGSGSGELPQGGYYVTLVDPVRARDLLHLLPCYPEQCTFTSIKIFTTIELYYSRDICLMLVVCT